MSKLDSILEDFKNAVLRLEEVLKQEKTNLLEIRLFSDLKFVLIYAGKP